MNEQIFRLKGKTLVCIDWANVFGWFRDLKWEIDPLRLYGYFMSYPEIYVQNFYFGKEVGNVKSENFQNDIANLGYNLISKEVKWIPVSLEHSHFKRLIKSLFNLLDNIKETNSEISNKLYNLIEKIKKASNGSAWTSAGEIEYSAFDDAQLDEIFEMINDLDIDLDKLNINIDELQKDLKKPVRRRKCDFDCEIVMDIMKEINNFSSLILVSGDGDYKAIVEHVLENGKQAIVIHPCGRRGREFNELLSRVGLKPYFCFVENLKPYLI